MAELSASLAVAESTKGPNPDVSPEKIAQVASAAARGARASTQTRRLLWVDDNPSNNSFPVRILRSLGIATDEALSTDEALEKLVAHRADVVITDMGRPPDALAGYTLLSAMRERGIRTPVIIFATGGSQAENRRRARQAGAFGSTNSVTELTEMVLSALDFDR